MVAFFVKQISTTDVIWRPECGDIVITTCRGLQVQGLRGPIPEKGRGTVRIALIGSLLLLTSWCRADPACEPPSGLTPAEIDQYCVIHRYRTDCLERLGYDMSSKGWLVEVSDFKGCTVWACNHFTSAIGALPESLIERVCYDPDLDRP